MEERVSVQITQKILLKIIKNPGKLKFTDLHHGIFFCQGRPGISEGTYKSNFSHKATFRRFFLTPHSPYPKRPSSKVDSLKRNEMKGNLRTINFQYWNEMTTKLARYIWPGKPSCLVRSAHLYHYFSFPSFLRHVKNDGKEKLMLKMSLIDRTAWFTRLARYIEGW